MISENSSGVRRRPLNLMIYEPYPMDHGGGNQRTLAYILQLIDRTKFTPIIVAPQSSEFLERVRSRGTEVVIEAPPSTIHRYGGQVLRDSALRRLRSVIDVVQYNLRLARLLREREIDVVYCNCIRAVLLAGLGARLAKVPALWYVKGVLDNALLDRLGFFVANRVAFFCESNKWDRYPWLVRLLNDKIGIVRIGLDAAVIDAVRNADHTALRRELDIRSGRLNAVILAQVYRPKGHHLIIERLREIVQAHPELMLYIVGDHVIDEFRSYRTELETMIAEQGLQDHVRFTGWRSDALAVVANMDMLIHPSLAEGFGRAVLEAMALGLPVVASAVGGLRELIRDGENGYLVPVGDSAAFADRVKRLAGDAALRARFGREARREVLENYQIEDRMRDLEAVWLDLARERPRAAAI